MNKIARTNKNRSEVNLIRNIFLDTNTKQAFHLGSRSKKVCITYFSEKWTCWSTYLFVHHFLFDPLVWWMVQNQIFRQRISIQISMSIAKFVDSLIRENNRSKLRIPFHRFWQLILFKWLQSSFSWRKILIKH